MVVSAIVIAALLLGAGVALALLLGLGVDFVFIGLVFAFLFFGALGLLLQLFPQSLPLISSARRFLSFFSLVALAALLYLYAYPAITRSADGWGGLDSGSRPVATAPPLTHPIEIVYTVTGDAASMSVTMLPSGDGHGFDTVETLPYTQTVQNSASDRIDGHYLLTAIASGGSAASEVETTLACTITVDGIMVAHDEATGPLPSVVCAGSTPAAAH